MGKSKKPLTEDFTSELVRTGDPKPKGRQPIIVTDKNDKRLRNYKDSLLLHNVTKDDIIKLKRMTPDQWRNYPHDWEETNPKAVAAAERLKAFNKKTPIPMTEFRLPTRKGDAVYIYKKPVQPVIYQPNSPVKRQPIVVEDFNDPQLRAYKDSLNSYTKGKKLYEEYWDMTFDEDEYQSRVKPGETFWGNSVREVSKGKGLSKDRVQPIAFIGKGDIPAYKKPVQKVVYRKPVPPKPVQNVIEAIKEEVIQKEQSTQPGYSMKGRQPVYGPSRALIGTVDTDGTFYPDFENTAGRTTVNRADSDLINDSDALLKYLQSKGLNVGSMRTKNKQNGGMAQNGYGAADAYDESLAQLADIVTGQQATRNYQPQEEDVEFEPEIEETEPVEPMEATESMDIPDENTFAKMRFELNGDGEVDALERIEDLENELDFYRNQEAETLLLDDEDDTMNEDDDYDYDPRYVPSNGVAAFAAVENNGKLDMSDHNSGSTAFGPFGFLKSKGGHLYDFYNGTAAFSGAAEYGYNKKFGSFDEFIKAMKKDKNMASEVNNRYYQQLMKYTNHDFAAAAAFNLGGYQGLKEYKAGNLDWRPTPNNMTLGAYIRRAMKHK